MSARFLVREYFFCGSKMGVGSSKAIAMDPAHRARVDGNVAIERTFQRDPVGGACVARIHGIAGGWRTMRNDMYSRYQTPQDWRADVARHRDRRWDALSDPQITWPPVPETKKSQE